MPNIIATSDNRDGLRLPTLSPDGKWLAYYDKIARKLLKKSVLGGPATTLCQGIAVVGVAWADDGFITFTDGNRPDLLLRVSEDGGEVTELKIPTSEEKWFRIVHALPGGKAILYSAFESKYAAGHGSIGVYSLETGQAKVLAQEGTYPLYAQSGHLLFLLNSTLIAAPLDTKSLEITGPAVPIPGLGDVSSGPYGSALFDITSNGTLYYREAETRRNANGIYRYAIESGGKPELISPRTGIYDRFSISFDAKFIAIEIGNSNEWIDWKANSIWVLDLRRDVLQRLTTEAGGQLTPMFSPDGVWVYYSAFDENGKWKGIYRRRRGDSSIDGAEPIEEGPRQFFVFSISSDGMHLLGAEAPDSSVSPDANWDIGLISLGENGEIATRTSWAVGPRGQAQPSISPDGQYVAYTSWDANTESTEVYVRPFDSSEESNLEYQVSNNGGGWAMWAPDGKTLYYVEGKDQSKLMAATVLTNAGPTGDGKLSRFEIGEVKELFGFGTFGLHGQEHVTIMPDGSGFLRTDIVQHEGAEKTSDDLTLIHVVRNFFTELERVAPTEKNDASR
jgi:serine/threonine-protein kinase